MKLIVETEVKSKVGGGIYCIECLKNGKRYIGSSTNLYKRYYSHLYLLRAGKHKSNLLQEDYNLYGEEQFTFTPIKLLTCPQEDLLKEETLFIKLTRSCIEGYNTVEDATTTAYKQVICKNLKTGKIFSFDTIAQCGKYLFDYAEKTNQGTTLKVCRGRISEIANQSRAGKNIFSFKDHTFSLSLEGLIEMESKIATGQKQRPVKIVELDMVFDSIKKAAEHISSIIGRRADPSNIRKGLNVGKTKHYGYTIQES